MDFACFFKDTEKMTRSWLTPAVDPDQTAKKIRRSAPQRPIDGR
jgi:hypothetical protein